eukprot:TRINITY_DN62280_c0_g1_i1.p1 TRINITY_DN62280_c0_g1~~TRINITY_DN62280_c0_g1_i1.p1  ORF type:complete len:447 (+),score=85.47 TRINITY_DN62280_c0_g1_i1:63-1403(+)
MASVGGTPPPQLPPSLLAPRARGSPRSQRDFARTEGIQLLQLCSKSSTYDRSLARCVDAQPLVVRCIAAQAVYHARVLAVLKRLLIAARVQPPPAPPPRLQNSGLGGLGSKLVLDSAPSLDAVSKDPLDDAPVSPHGGAHSRLLNALLPLLDEAARPSMSAASPAQLGIGLIGCGQVGSAALEALLDSRVFHATCFTVATRQPERHQQFAACGVRFTRNCALAAKGADLLLICVLPAQLEDVARELRSALPPACVVVSALAGVPAARLAAALGHPFCLTTRVDVGQVAGFCSALAERRVRRDPLPAEQFGQLMRVACPHTANSSYLSEVAQALLGSAQRRGLVGAPAVVCLMMSILPARVGAPAARALPWQLPHHSTATGGADRGKVSPTARRRLPPPLWWGGVPGIAALCGGLEQDVVDAAAEHFALLNGAAAQHVHRSRLPLPR